ncbi:uncharacterized protein B0H18DRAFT_1124116, partial [Fomitopsis serialis]|uniref:uncharacterized protein n=1 Tax=Fomitopsis serialis TaxID=139415 RepID=UPI0020089F1E
MSRRETRSTAPSRDTRSAPSKSKAAAASKPPSAGSKRTSTSKPVSKKGAAGSTKPAANAATEAAPMTYAERLNLMKNALRPQRPDLTARALDVLARSMVAEASKKGNEEKERLDTIQTNAAAMMAAEHDREHASDEMPEDEASLEDQSPQASKRKDKTTSPRRRKRKAQQDEENASSDAESSPLHPTRVSPKQRKRKARQDEEMVGSDAGSSPEQPKKKQKKSQVTNDASPKLVEVEESSPVRLKNKQKEAQATKNASPGPDDVMEGETTVHRKPVEKEDAVSKDEDRVASLLARNSNKPTRTRRVRKVLESSDDEVHGDTDMDELQSSDPEGKWLPLRSSSPTRSTKRPRNQPGKLSVQSPINVDDSGDESSSFKPPAEEQDDDSERDGGEERDSDDGLIVKDVEQHSGRKGKGKVSQKAARAKDAGAKDAASQSSNDPLMKEPIKSFLQRAQQELRVYIAVENAWPRKRGQRVEKFDVPQDIIELLVEKNAQYQTEDFQETYQELWENTKMKNRMIKYVYKVAAQVRQELKQKAKRVVEKEFLSVKISGVGLDAVARNDKLQKAKEARIKYLRNQNTFHYGNVVMPDPDVSPELWDEPELDTPFHSVVIAEIMARQWWLGQHPEALRRENRSRFDINVKPPSSNMIALTCSAILVAFDEALAGNTTVNFDEKTYATEHDRLKAGIDRLRKHADANSRMYDEGIAELVKSMNDTMVSNIMAFAGIAHDKSQRDEGSTQEVDDGIDMQAVLGRWGKKKAPASAVSGVQSQAGQ